MRPLLSESGGHRWQRCPPTERRGRVHTSTVTVAVLPSVAQKEWRIADRDVEVRTTRGSGPGGQNRNKVESTVVCRHLPTGITVRIDTRDQHRNRLIAREILETRVAAHYRGIVLRDANDKRRSLLGSGERGDKVRTYREMDGIVSDHRSGKKAPLMRIKEGRLDMLR